MGMEEVPEVMENLHTKDTLLKKLKTVEYLICD